ncbi:hypothetical protein FC56_GL001506 [Lentilactobacillus senioris DSM 24302 = JCM 17472]|uniref:Uncharacterized protein n=1 Tax=Lentilactobacillus senioris DSM 24302 = JCM 17472 TaxID=1423802 RepID=A0A0R2CXU8_9LACO|nr:hypothetical protein FC56_GL001506 [Lentilactobacillus senioris DSM 24302 = JCM 17472]
MLDSKHIIIVVHGNLSKYVEGISDEDIINLEMATGELVVYDFADKLNVVLKTKLD